MRWSAGILCAVLGCAFGAEDTLYRFKTCEPDKLSKATGHRFHYVWIASDIGVILTEHPRYEDCTMVAIGTRSFPIAGDPVQIVREMQRFGVKTRIIHIDVNRMKEGE